MGDAGRLTCVMKTAPANPPPRRPPVPLETTKMIALLAYFDPSAGSLLLQALVGGFGGLVVLGRYTWMQLFISRNTHVIAVGTSQAEMPVLE